MERKDVTLLAIASAGPDGLTPVQLQKSLFLVGQAGLPFKPREFYEFFPYNYGPFHPDVYRDADALVAEGLVASLPVPGRNWSRYAVTLAGVTRSRTVVIPSDTRFVAYVQAVVTWVKSLSFNDLLRAIYARYPQFAKNSVFQG